MSHIFQNYEHLATCSAPFSIIESTISALKPCLCTWVKMNNTSMKKLTFPSLAPLNITQSLTDINVLLGQSGTLSITCDAFPAPKVTW